MKDDVAEVQCQLEEERREQRLQPNYLFCLLDRCHKSLSQTIQVETNAALTTQGEVTDPVIHFFKADCSMA